MAISEVTPVTVDEITYMVTVQFEGVCDHEMYVFVECEELPVDRQSDLWCRIMEQFAIDVALAK